MSFLKFERRLNPNLAKLHHAARPVVPNWNLDREQSQPGHMSVWRKKMDERFLEQEFPR